MITKYEIISSTKLTLALQIITRNKTNIARLRQSILHVEEGSSQSSPQHQYASSYNPILKFH
jgi:hypothetical protein